MGQLLQVAQLIVEKVQRVVVTVEAAAGVAAEVTVVVTVAVRVERVVWVWGLVEEGVCQVQVEASKDHPPPVWGPVEEPALEHLKLVSDGLALV